MTFTARRRSTPEPAEFFHDEETLLLRREVAELRDLYNGLAEQVQAQFTSIAAHAEIARTQTEFVAAEAKANLQRTHSGLLALLDQLNARIPSDGAPAPTVRSLPAASPQLDVIGTITDLTAQVAVCLARQNELAGLMTLLVDAVEPAGGPILALRFPDPAEPATSEPGGSQRVLAFPPPAADACTWPAPLAA